MELLFDRMMSLEQYASLCANIPPVLIAGYRGNLQSLQEALGITQVIALDHREEYTSSSSTSADIHDIIEIYQKNKTSCELGSCDKLENYFRKEIPYDTTVLIDITSMGVRLLAIVLSSLAEALRDRSDISRVYCGYSEAKTYKRRGILDGNLPQFELYSDFAPLGPLPNFSSIGSDDQKQLWVVLLGFEGYRTDIFVDDLPRIDDIIALVTVPSFRLGWSNYAAAENAQFLHGINKQAPVIEYVTAVSPFSAYNRLCQIQEKYRDYRLQISPFGTKANSLGVLLYALNDPNCLIIFDNPIEKSRPRGEFSDTYHVYDITVPLKRVELEGDY